MITTREEYLRQASEKEFLTREERLGIRATDSWKESVPMADVQEQALVTLSVVVRDTV